MTGIVAQLDAVRWKFAEADPVARAEMKRRIASIGRNRALITYSALVEGVTLALPNVNNGEPFQIDTSDWRDLDRAILGEFLGAISADTYRAAEFFATAPVVNQEERRPSGRFFKWMRELGLIRRRGQGAETEFWIGEVATARDWYSQH